ncbi:RNA polymerase subunit sigma [Streptomyces sp. CB00455]|uniref:sigma factor-like helix-turn-helix DNA-binding protein n=1 Tax=Streptomyces sp. CB00455 TaxID=1703927 RepID=UPI00093974BA|nr:sigma factor-like helix-turn-helix DNA-binding protein [Streptomyces sp. CB00455]OKK16062.1 RNA polymerase subunit sigma [Streptomyces sp. CB00455]
MFLEGASAEFHGFFERHCAELARLAYLLTGDAAAADDLAADALVAIRHRWDRLRRAGDPLACARGVVADMARKSVRGTARERRRVASFRAESAERGGGPDVTCVMDVRTALGRLPFRRRTCVVLRCAFDLSEEDTALALGISPGTVRRRTSKGLAELERLLGAGVFGEPVERRS